MSISRESSNTASSATPSDDIAPLVNSDEQLANLVDRMKLMDKSEQDLNALLDVTKTLTAKQCLVQKLR